MRVLVAGGTGLVGQPLARSLLERGDSVVVVGRSKEHIAKVFGDAASAETYDSLTAELVGGCDAVVNLAGESIGAASWTEAAKQRILDSRVQATSRLAGLVAASSSGQTRLLNGSAIGIYGSQEEGDESLKDEAAEAAQGRPDFLAEVCAKWEAAASAELPPERVVLLRTGIVLSPGSGALGSMERPFRLGLGGRMGRGTQCMSWISLEDEVRAVLFLLDRPEVHGPVNLASGFVSQMVFAQALAAALHRPCVMPAPSFAVKLLLGSEMADGLVLGSQRVDPRRLREAGFEFGDMDIFKTLARLYA